MFEASLEPTKKDGKVARVCDGGDNQGAETLIELKGKVRRTGDQGRKQRKVWVAERADFIISLYQKHFYVDSRPVVHHTA